MGIRKKILISIASVLGAVMLLVYVATSFFLLKNLDSTEDREIRGDTERTAGVFLNEATVLDTKLADWSQWDDTYRFVADRNSEYVDSNLGTESLAALRINYIVIADESGNIIADPGVDFVNGKELKLPDDLRREFGPGGFLADHHDPAVSKAGIIDLATGPAFVSSRPILTSKGEGPSRGTIAFVRLIDDALMKRLSGLTHFDIHAEWYGNGTADAAFDAARGFFQTGTAATYTAPESGSVIAGYALLPELHGGKAMILRIENPRTIHAQGVRSVEFFGIALLLLWALAFFLIFFLTEKFVLSKISYLGVAVSRMETEGRAATNIYLPGHDEFSGLAMKINGMVTALNIFREREEVAEKRFEIIAREAPVMIWMADPDKSVNYFNKAWLDFTGRPLELEIGRGWTESIHPGDLEVCVGSYYAAFDLREPFSIECRIRSHDGAYAWVRTTGVSYYSESKTFLGYIGVSIDITDRKNEEEREVGKLHETERLNAIITDEKQKGDAILGFLRSIGDGVIATDMQGRIMFSNEAAVKLIAPDGDLGGRHHGEVFRVVSERDPDHEECFIKDVLETRERINGRGRQLLVRTDGTQLPISYTAAPIRDANGGMLGCIAVLKDITEEREAERVKDRFLSVSAHQLRTPLSGMRWSIEMLLSGDLGGIPDEAMEMLERIYANNTRMIVLVDDLLDVSRINEGNYVEEPESTDIVALVAEVVSNMRSEAEDKRVRLSYGSPEVPFPKVMAVPKRLYEAIENLVSNAIKYTEADKGVTVSLATSDGIATLSVKDEGIGIPAREQEKIFSKFFRASNAMRKSTEGSGLGLSVVKSFVEEIGGSVRFESEEGRGTTFLVEIPIEASGKKKR